jgi:hypothetical protein
MTPLAQIIVAIGLGGLLLLLGIVAVIWAIRCDPKRPHYKLPAFAALAGPAVLALLVWLKTH